MSQHHRGDLDEVGLFATQWMRHDNHQRPHVGLVGGATKQRLAMAAWFYLKSPLKMEGGITDQPLTSP